MMPGGSPEAYKFIQPIVEKVAAQVDDGPCVTYIGDGGAGNFVKMVHNGIEYGDMQLIAEGYDILRNIGGLTNEELCIAFNEWNKVQPKTRVPAMQQMRQSRACGQSRHVICPCRWHQRPRLCDSVVHAA